MGISHLAATTGRSGPGRAPLARPAHGPPDYPGHAHFWERALSRRRFVQAAAGATAAAVGAGLWAPALARAAQAEDHRPRPISVGIEFGGKFFRVRPPGLGEENSMITDFDGAVAACLIRGTGTGRDTATGATEPLIFDVDMRFMQGVYVGMDGHRRLGTFGFVWLDIYRGPVDPQDPFASQLHDYDPGITDTGLFWTIPMPHESVAVDFGQATASMRASDLPMPDYFTIPNALGLVPHPVPPVPATVSFDVRWSGVARRAAVTSAELGFTGQFIEDHSTIWWSSRQEGFEFVSDAAETSASYVSVLGHQRNGVFFR